MFNPGDKVQAVGVLGLAKKGQIMTVTKVHYDYLNLAELPNSVLVPKTWMKIVPEIVLFVNQETNDA